MSRLMGMINITKFLCLRETSLTDDALCKFFGTSLEYLDVSETAVRSFCLNYGFLQCAWSPFLFLFLENIYHIDYVI